MDNFLAELNPSSSVLALGNVNQSETPPLSTFSAGETLPLISNRINSTPDDEILLLPPTTDRMSSQLNSSESEPTHIAGEPRPNGKKQDILTGDDIVVPSRQTRSGNYNWDIYTDVLKAYDNDIDALIGDIKWDMNYLGNEITYSFLEVGDFYYDSKPGLAELNATAKNLARRVMNDLEDIVPIDFVEVPYSYDNPAVIVLMGVDTEWGGYATMPAGSLTAGDVYLSNDNDYSSDYAYKTVAHEVGHALGLKHPGDYTKFGSDAVPPYLPQNKDNTNWTVMSYYNKYPMSQDYQSLDIKALQYLYGESGGGSRTPLIEINDISITEGDRTKQATFKVTLDTPATETVKVGYQTVSDTASSGDDYRYKSGTITFKPGQKNQKD